ncbi:MAG: YbaK/EbsC family protein [Phascolarctobacterium sp.]
MAFSEQAILQLLEEHHINYIVRKHEPIFTVAQGEALGLPNVQAAVKSLLLTDDKHQSYYLVVLPLDKRLDLKELRAKIGSRRLTMASSQELMQLLGLTPGAVTPFGLLQDKEHRVQTFFDAELKENTIATHLDSNTATVWLHCHKLVHLLEAKGHKSTYLPL